MRVVLALLVAAGALTWSVPSAGVEEKCIALTFDDGPDKNLTPKLLDILKREGVSATLYVVGNRVKQWPEIVRRAHEAKHEIGNHSCTHPWLSHLSTAAAKREVECADGAIEAATGEKPATIRAPFGAIPADLEAVTGGRPIVSWEPDTRDAFKRNSANVTKIALEKGERNGIVLMHDTHAWTLEAVPAIIRGFKERGFRFVKISEFLKGACGFIARPPLVYTLNSQVPERLSRRARHVRHARR